MFSLFICISIHNVDIEYFTLDYARLKFSQKY